ncbi:MAG: PHP domain-containing protein [bacterium]
MLLKGCLHVHTTCSDGKLTPQEAADVYAAMGYDFIAFTDHDYLLKPDAEEVYDGVKTEMIIFKGVELTVFEKGYIHVNRIRGDVEELHVLNHLGEYDLTLEQVMERIEATAKRFPLDAVEITTKGFPDREFEIEGIRYPKIAGDDSHTREGCGRAWIEMDCRRSKDSIIRAVKRGRFWNCYARG